MPGPAWQSASMPTLISCLAWNLRDQRGRCRESLEKLGRHPIAGMSAERTLLVQTG